MAIQLIHSIDYTQLQDVISFLPGLNGTVEILSRKWITLPMHPASGDMSTVSRNDAAGTSYATSISARLSKSIPVVSNVILRVKLCSGKTVIVGTPDIPASFSKNSTLTLDQISASVTSWVEPLTAI